MNDRKWILESLTGPVASVRTPFLRDGDVDFDGLRSQIDFNIAAGTRTLMLTAGDSHYFTLSDQEIADITRATVEYVDRRAMVIAADRHFNTHQAVSFAEYCAQIGADVLMVMPPDWARSCTPETLAAHYTAVAEHIPVMIVTNVFVPRGEVFGLQTIEKTLAANANVIAVKDDMCGAFARKMALKVQGKWAVIAGGQKQNHLNTYPYGCDGYLSCFISFRPEIARRYWSAIESNSISDAVAVIRDYDFPFFKLVSGIKGGFDAGIHGTLELFGICSRWRRLPYHTLSDAEMDQLKSGLKSIGIL